MKNLLEMLNGLINFFVLSFVLAAAITILSQTWRKNLGYPVVAVVLGTLVAYGSSQVPMLESWSYLIGPATTILAPGLVLWAQHKTPEDLIKMLKDVKISFKKD